MQLTDAAFSEAYPKVRTQVKFSSEFHRSKYSIEINDSHIDRRMRKSKKSGGIFGDNEVNMIAGEDGG